MRASDIVVKIREFIDDNDKDGFTDFLMNIPDTDLMELGEFANALLKITTIEFERRKNKSKTTTTIIL